MTGHDCILVDFFSNKLVAFPWICLYADFLRIVSWDLSPLNQHPGEYCFQTFSRHVTKQIQVSHMFQTVRFPILQPLQPLRCLR